MKRDLMTCEEIRTWMKVLHEEHGWPYKTLGRTLGIGDGKHAASKVRGNSSIYRREQTRMSRQLDRIICGELVPKLTIKNGGRRVDAAPAEHPVRLDIRMRMAVDPTTGRLFFVRRRPVVAKPTLTFAQGVEAFR